MCAKCHFPCVTSPNKLHARHPHAYKTARTYSAPSQHAHNLRHPVCAAACLAARRNKVIETRANKHHASTAAHMHASAAANNGDKACCLCALDDRVLQFVDAHKSSMIFCTAMASLHATVLLHAEDSYASTSATTTRFSIKLLFHGAVPMPRVAHESLTCAFCSCQACPHSVATR